MLIILLYVIMAHTVGDYLFQSNYIAQNKGKDNYILFIHSVLYAVSFLILGYAMKININSTKLLVIALGHYPVDYIKARGISTKVLGESKALIMDQIIHYLFILAVLSF